MIKSDESGTMVTGLDVELLHLLTLRSALRLEIGGLRHSRGSVYAHLKKRFGWRGSRTEVLDALEREIVDFQLRRTDCPECGSGNTEPDQLMNAIAEGIVEMTEGRARPNPTRICRNCWHTFTRTGR